MPFTKKRNLAHPDRRAVAVLLAKRGPMHGDDVAHALGWTEERWWDVINRADDWFMLTGKGWALTPVGRVEIAEAELDHAAVNE